MASLKKVFHSTLKRPCHVHVMDNEPSRSPWLYTVCPVLLPKFGRKIHDNPNHGAFSNTSPLERQIKQGGVVLSQTVYIKWAYTKCIRSSHTFTPDSLDGSSSCSHQHTEYLCAIPPPWIKKKGAFLLSVCNKATLAQRRSHSPPISHVYKLAVATPCSSSWYYKSKDTPAHATRRRPPCTIVTRELQGPQTKAQQLGWGHDRMALKFSLPAVGTSHPRESGKAIGVVRHGWPALKGNSSDKLECNWVIYWA